MPVARSATAANPEELSRRERHRDMHTYNLSSLIVDSDLATNDTSHPLISDHILSLSNIMLSQKKRQ